MSVLKKSLGEKTFDIFNVIFMFTIMFVTIYPLLYVLFASVSEPNRLIQHQGLLFSPVGFTLKGYKLTFENPNIYSGYINTLIYVFVGTFLNVFVTMFGAYGLSRKNVFWKKHILFFIAFTMFFSGGLIPRFLIIKEIGLLDSRWALILPTLIGTWNLLLMKTSFSEIPNSLEESAKLDGAGHYTVLFRIFIPLSKPIIAVMLLFYGVAHWNQWVDAMIFLRSRVKYPLQLILREILIENNTQLMMQEVSSGESLMYSSLIKYSTVIVATAPILFVYPFLQKYFMKGIMVGAIKG